MPFLTDYIEEITSKERLKEVVFDYCQECSTKYLKVIPNNLNDKFEGYLSFDLRLIVPDKFIKNIDKHFNRLELGCCDQVRIEQDYITHIKDMIKKYFIVKDFDMSGYRNNWSFYPMNVKINDDDEVSDKPKNGKPKIIRFRKTVYQKLRKNNGKICYD